MSKKTEIIAKRTKEDNFENKNILTKEKPKFKIGARVRIFKWENKFEKDF